MRAGLGVFANLRPAFLHEPLIEASPLKEAVVRGTDMIIVRELMGGAYFGQPREITEERGLNSMVYTAPEVERIARVAFDIARGRKKKLHSIDKANVLEVSQLWRKVVNRVALEYPDVQLEHGYVDSCAMALVTRPTAYDVIVTENLFGDILSDEAAVLTGSLGMLPSASIGGKVGLYEPVHGSAPDIAGQGNCEPARRYRVGGVDAALHLQAGRRGKDVGKCDQRSVSRRLWHTRSEEPAETGRHV